MKSLHHFVTSIKHYILLCDDLVGMFMFYKCNQYLLCIKLQIKILKYFPLVKEIPKKLCLEMAFGNFETKI